MHSTTQSLGSAENKLVPWLLQADVQGRYVYRGAGALNSLKILSWLIKHVETASKMRHGRYDGSIA